MSNQLQNKAATLAQILATNRLTKAANQEIIHKDPMQQKSLGEEQTKEIDDNVAGVPEGQPAPSRGNGIQEIPGVQSLNATAEKALDNSGSGVTEMTEDGTPTDQLKTASIYRRQLGSILNALDKRANLQNNFRTGYDVLSKFASLNANSSQQDIVDAQNELIKLASTNPVFHVCRDRIVMQKLAEDIDALAEAEGISPDQAAEELQAAADANPEMLEEIGDEATGEAVADLANAEVATDELMTGIQGLADNASANLGMEITPEDIVNAAEETEAMAEELGVPPEALIQAAMEEIAGGEEAGAEVTEEDLANADQILQAAAENGISPEEVIQMAASELEGGEEAPEAPVEKAASLQKRASTMRAAFVQELRRRR